MKIRIRNARLTYSLCAVLLCILAATVVFAQQMPSQAPPGTPLFPQWPFVSATLKSFTSTQFTAGDYVCVDIVNSTTSTLYVKDNGTVRCAVNQPQAGIAWITDPLPSVSHSVIIDPDAPRVAVNCPLGSCPPVYMLPPCSALVQQSCFR